MTKIDELKFDDKNFNKHTEFGMGLLEKSLRENGAGRSILLDKDNNIIAGNGVVEAAGQIGLENVKIIETTGDEIVAVKRTDISLNSREGREMALADNATAKADIEWDKENLQSEFTDEEQKEWERLVSLNRKVITLAEQEETLKRAKQMVSVGINQIVKFPEPFQLYGHTYDAVVQCDSGTLIFLDTKHYWTGEL